MMDMATKSYDPPKPVPMTSDDVNYYLDLSQAAQDYVLALQPTERQGAMYRRWQAEFDPSVAVDLLMLLRELMANSWKIARFDALEEIREP